MALLLRMALSFSRWLPEPTRSLDPSQLSRWGPVQVHPPCLTAEVGPYGSEHPEQPAVKAQVGQENKHGRGERPLREQDAVQIKAVI